MDISLGETAIFRNPKCYMEIDLDLLSLTLQSTKEWGWGGNYRVIDLYETFYYVDLYENGVDLLMR